MTAYYNDNDPTCAAWLRELIAAGLIAPGDVDERSIADVQPEDVRGYSQCHWFGGIGGWSYALRLAGWPDDEPVWTASLPCQPFSAAGRGLADRDERHLWPEFYRLISECKPTTVFGEQVASRLGREWLAGVFDDLERVGFAVAGADLCAACVGAPHIRQRLWWMAYSQDPDRRAGECPEEAGVGQNGERRRGPPSDGEGCLDPGPWWDTDECLCADGKRRRIEPFVEPLVDGFPERVGLLRGYGNSIVPQVAAEFIKAAREAIDGSDTL